MIHVPTGTGPHRRRLTLDEAQRGVQPEPFTREEWAAMEAASGEETTAKIRRVVGAMLREAIAHRRGE